jgi:hypothetical protein
VTRAAERGEAAGVGFRDEADALERRLLAVPPRTHLSRPQMTSAHLARLSERLRYPADRGFREPALRTAGDQSEAASPIATIRAS